MKQPLLGNHNRCWVWGRNVVLESLRAGRWLPYEVRVNSEVMDEATRDELHTLCELHSVELIEVSPTDLKKHCPTGDHQGLIAKMPPYPYVELNELLSSVGGWGRDKVSPPVSHRSSGGSLRLTPATPTDKDIKGSTPASILITDGLQDDYNFGAVVRNVDGFGLDGLIIPTRNQTGVTSQVARSSAGAVNHVAITRVEDLTEAIRTLQQHGIHVTAASERGTMAVSDTNLQQPCALIIGNEGTGIRPEVLDACDTHVTIPMQGHVGSLNAAVASGVLLYELTRQRGN
ncbi:23S rRNA (guanosine(2251)-2'-O)-methyltransferase RlmB [Calycomorphotria hydatis]|uniref:TrmH family tRNA/rRNA methyltransferase n=1 Tax=Calycomorphotria hydatis TaxID=2528027 RepID=A0A517TDA8_9PLAN|nr:23S rRNA (guanosine(2251)-2'-O)-methyltransferase RlmB [Calycomorphotria hydatis]QDT66352.1 Putative TrmH family tRNA/rRNA methyltransferase [Calycomorphotria hydatis]